MITKIGIFAFCATLGWGATIGTETFDTDNGVMTANTVASVVVHSGTGGNPDGHMLTRRDLGEAFFDIGGLTTDSRFTGDYGAAGITGMTVDLNFMTANFTDAWFRVRMDVVTNGWRHELTNSFGTNSWDTYNVAFDPTWSDVDAYANGWVKDIDIDPLANDSPSFATVMASVGRAEIRLGTTDESSLAGIDNFGLTGEVPEPGTMLLMSAGIGLIGLAHLRRR